MVPKESVPSKNLIRHRGSSSSIPNSARFHDEKVKEDFYENFSDQAIHSKRHVILSDFPDTPLLYEFSSWGWASLWEIPKRCPNVFI